METHNTRTRLQWKLLDNGSPHARSTRHGEYSPIRSGGTRNWSCRYTSVRITLYILIPCASPATPLRPSPPVHDFHLLSAPDVLRSPRTLDTPQERTHHAGRVDELLKAVEAGQLTLSFGRDAGEAVLDLRKYMSVVAVSAFTDVQRPGGVPARGAWPALNVFLCELDGDFLKDVLLCMVDEMGCENWLG